MFGIRGIDRGKHVYVIGKTGMGKSTMLENMAIQDIQNGEGIAFIDPHGSTAEKLLDFVPHERLKDVVYFAPFDTDYPVGFNVMEDVGYDKRHLVVSGLVGALKRIWVDAWSARMEYILQNTLLALLEYPGSTLLDVNRMLTNKTFRAEVVTKVTDPIVKSFWTEEFASFTDTYTREATPAIQNKIGQFTANPLIRNIIGQPTSTFNLREIMDKKKIFIVNLSKGRMGETNASLLGSMLVVKIYLAAMSRADEPAARMAALPRFYFYVDEFQSMMNQAFADILSESRKYKLALTLANQYIEQMEEEVRDAVFGNVGTLIVFRVGPFDAEVLETVFDPTFTPEDLVGLGIGQIYLTLMIDGVGSKPFSAETIPPIERPNISYRDDCVLNSREQYARPRAEIESYVMKRALDFAPPPKAPKEPKAGTSWGSRPRDGDSFRSERPREESLSPREILAQRAPAQTPAYQPHGAPAHSYQSQTPRSFERSEAQSPAQSRWGSPAAAQRSPEPRAQPPAAHDAEEEKRNSLRAAIQAAKPPAVSQSNRPEPAVFVRSPADVLREKRNFQPQNQPQRQQFAHPTPQPAHPPSPPAQNFAPQSPRPQQPERPSQFASQKEIHQHPHQDPKSYDGEISNEELRNVLGNEDDEI